MNEAVEIRSQPEVTVVLKMLHLRHPHPFRDVRKAARSIATRDDAQKLRDVVHVAKVMNGSITFATHTDYDFLESSFQQICDMHNLSAAECRLAFYIAIESTTESIRLLQGIPPGAGLGHLRRLFPSAHVAGFWAGAIEHTAGVLVDQRLATGDNQ